MDRKRKGSGQVEFISTETQSKSLANIAENERIQKLVRNSEFRIRDKSKNHEIICDLIKRIPPYDLTSESATYENDRTMAFRARQFRTSKTRLTLTSVKGRNEFDRAKEKARSSRKRAQRPASLFAQITLIYRSRFPSHSGAAF